MRPKTVHDAVMTGFAICDVRMRAGALYYEMDAFVR
jgi:hypothetical protein